MQAITIEKADFIYPKAAIKKEPVLYNAHKSAVIGAKILLFKAVVSKSAFFHF
jgi:hypothetical protein